MLDAVIGNFLDDVSEREFDAPFMALLRARDFYDSETAVEYAQYRSLVLTLAIVLDYCGRP
jgi:hypothetical protein